VAHYSLSLSRNFFKIAKITVKKFD